MTGPLVALGKRAIETAKDMQRSGAANAQTRGIKGTLTIGKLSWRFPGLIPDRHLQGLFRLETELDTRMKSQRLGKLLGNETDGRVFELAFRSSRKAGTKIFATATEIAEASGLPIPAYTPPEPTGYRKRP
jgi:hypothetical protein